jgi:hypothetical protein
MRIAARVVSLAAIAGLGIWLWGFLFPSPDKIIRRQLTQLAARVSFTRDEGNLERLADAERVADFFSSNVEVNVDLPGHEQHALAGRDEITQAALGSRQAVNWLALKFPDINVSVAADQASAGADVTADVSVPGETDVFVEELKISFEKSDRHWLINKIETVRAISQPVLK